jgi:hypothetical protein
MRSAASAKQNDTRLYGYGPSRKLNQHCSGKAARSVAGAPQAIQGPRATAQRERRSRGKRYQRKQPHSAGGAAGSQGPRSAGGAA